MKALLTNEHRSVLRQGVPVLMFLALLPLSGCVPQQADLKQTERSLQQRIKQTSDESAQTRARQSQEISVLREQELPQLRGTVDRVLHQIQDLNAKVDSLAGRTKRNPSSETDEQGPSFKSLESRLDSHDELLSSLLVQLAELTKQVKALEKR
ncbi:MAG: hypothetical protein Q8S75_12435 [Nitrospirota bacterium]|nr:hypothetical protein [Nitrospirota bacterium]